MNLEDVHAIHVYRTQRRRVGRGWGSGMGKTSTRGEKGQGRRSGTKFRLRFEGGRFSLPPGLKPTDPGYEAAQLQQDNDLFQTGRL